MNGENGTATAAFIDNVALMLSDNPVRSEQSHASTVRLGGVVWFKESLPDIWCNARTLINDTDVSHILIGYKLNFDMAIFGASLNRIEQNVSNCFAKERWICLNCYRSVGRAPN